MCGLAAVSKATAARLFDFKKKLQFIKVSLHINVSLDKLCSRSFESVCVCVGVGVGGRVNISIDSGITGEPVHFPSQGRPTFKEPIRPIRPAFGTRIFRTHFRPS